MTLECVFERGERREEREGVLCGHGGLEELRLRKEKKSKGIKKMEREKRKKKTKVVNGK